MNEATLAAKDSASSLSEGGLHEDFGSTRVRLGGGEHREQSESLVIDQALVDTLTDATDRRQWIPVEPAAGRERRSDGIIADGRPDPPGPGRKFSVDPGVRRSGAGLRNSRRRTLPVISSSGR